VIQNLRCTYDSSEYSMQLFASKKAFEAEASVYKDKSAPLQRFLPKLHVRSASRTGYMISSSSGDIMNSDGTTAHCSPIMLHACMSCEVRGSDDRSQNRSPEQLQIHEVHTDQQVPARV
jgi:hypothetical protein